MRWMLEESNRAAKECRFDMSTPKPVDDALNVFEDYLKQFETATK